MGGVAAVIGVAVAEDDTGDGSDRHAPVRGRRRGRDGVVRVGVGSERHVAAGGGIGSWDLDRVLRGWRRPLLRRLLLPLLRRR